MRSLCLSGTIFAPFGTQIALISLWDTSIILPQGVGLVFSLTKPGKFTMRELTQEELEVVVGGNPIIIEL
jgi:hypothetical protein